MTSSVPQSMGRRLKVPDPGCHDGSAKKRPRPTCGSAGKDSQARKATIRRTIAPAAAEKIRRTQIRSRSLLAGDKRKLPNRGLGLGREGEVEELARGGLEG